MKVIILTTRLNSVWLSMQEIIPGIESLWTHYGASRNIETTIINCDQGLDLVTSLKDLLEAKIIIVTAFNLKIVQAIRLIRIQLGIDAPIAFYLHNQATIACWPLKKWKLLDCLKTHDYFISTCKRDAETLRAVFKNANCLITPFTYQKLDEPRQINDFNFSKKSKNFVYIGRISDQKNLHTLITAFSLIKSSDILHLFGGEDFLGSPNMAIPSTETLKNLKELTEKLNIQSRVFFHGHQPREDLYHYLNLTPHIFVSASLHSDENFGMAAFRSLCLGVNAILSNWGGHTDFASHFENQVQYVSVSDSERGPFVNPSELAELMTSSKTNEQMALNIPLYYQAESLFNTLDTIMNSTHSETRDLEPSALSLAVWEQQNEIAGETLSRAFRDYQDPLARAFFRLYGAQVAPTSTHPPQRLVPWVKKQGTGFQVIDPHRGEFPLENEQELANLGYLF